jgi:hypothetical protein
MFASTFSFSFFLSKKEEGWEHWIFPEMRKMKDLISCIHLSSIVINKCTSNVMFYSWRIRKTSPPFFPCLMAFLLQLAHIEICKINLSILFLNSHVLIKKKYCFSIWFDHYHLLETSFLKNNFWNSKLRFSTYIQFIW